MTQLDYRKCLELQQLSERLKNPDTAYMLLRQSLEPDDDHLQDFKNFVSILSTVARAYGVEKLSVETGVHKISIYKILRNQVSMPTLRNLIKIINAMGLKFSLEKLEKK